MRIVLIGTVLVALLGHPSHAQQTKSTHYCYDSLGRIEKATFHDNRQFVFTYDENHNLTHVQKTFSSDPSCSSFTAKSAPQGSAKAATGEAGDAQTASSPGRGRIPRPDDGDYAAPPLDVAVVTDRVTRPQAAPGSLGDRPRPKNAPLPPPLPGGVSSARPETVAPVASGAANASRRVRRTSGSR